jgi:hypothetical protein
VASSEPERSLLAALVCAFGAARLLLSVLVAAALAPLAVSVEVALALPFVLGAAAESVVAAVVAPSSFALPFSGLVAARLGVTPGAFAGVVVPPSPVAVALEAPPFSTLAAAGLGVTAPAGSPASRVGRLFSPPCALAFTQR